MKPWHDNGHSCPRQWTRRHASRIGLRLARSGWCAGVALFFELWNFYYLSAEESATLKLLVLVCWRISDHSTLTFEGTESLIISSLAFDGRRSGGNHPVSSLPTSARLLWMMSWASSRRRPSPLTALSKRGAVLQPRQGVSDQVGCVWCVSIFFSLLSCFHFVFHFILYCLLFKFFIQF